MKSKFITLLVSITLIMGSYSKVFASGPLFSQSFSNPLNLNPAYAGSLGNSRLAFAYRNQYPAIPGNYIFSSLSYDHYIPKLSSGFGFKYDYKTQGEGEYTSNSYSVLYALNFKIRHLNIRPAINFGIQYEKYDGSDLIFGPQSQNTIPTGTQKNLNLGMGILFAYKNLIAGASIDHINRPDVDILSDDILYPLISAHANYLIKYNKELVFMPAIVYQHQNDFNTYLPSLMMKYKHLKVGTAYRYFNKGSDDLVGMIGFVNNFMSIGYSYDLSLSKLANTNGSHEISVVLNFNCKKDKEKYALSQLYEF